jgi:hypothetical protein
MSKYDSIRQKRNLGSSKYDAMRSYRDNIGVNTFQTKLEPFDMERDSKTIFHVKPPRPIENHGVYQWMQKPKKEPEKLSVAQNFVRGTGNLIDGLVPFGDPIKKGLLKDVDNEWLNETFRPATTTKQKVLDGINEFGGSAVPVGAAYKIADKGLDALKGISKLEKTTKSKNGVDYLDEAQKGLLTGTAYGIQDEVGKATTGESQGLLPAVRNVAVEGTIGAVADPAIMGVGQGIKKGAQKLFKPGQPKKEEILTSQTETPEIEKVDEAIVNQKPSSLNPETKSEIDQMQQTYKQMEDEYVQSHISEYDDILQQTIESEKLWEQAKEARNELNRINSMFDRNSVNIPEGFKEEWGKRLPAHLKAAKGKGSRDIYQMAEELGFASDPQGVEEMLNYIDSLRKNSNVRKQDILPPDSMNQKEYEMLEESLRQSFRQSEDAQGLNDTIEILQASLVDVGDEATVTFKEADEVDSLVNELDVSNLKDTGNYETATNDVFRMFQKVFGKSKQYDKIKYTIIEPLENAKANYTTMQKEWLQKLKSEVVDKLGIKKGSKESRLVQQFGEKEIDLDELKKLAPKKWKDIVEADKWFRQSYDELIDQVNASRRSVYGNNTEKLVPKRQDYYRHFRELQGISGLKNIFDSPSAIDPTLAGVSQYTQPKTKWQSFMQKRGMGPYKRDAVGGFLDYIPAAAYSTKIDPVIPKFRAFQKSLANRIKETGTNDKKQLNNFLEFLVDYSNDLAGKTNPYFDRTLQKIIPGGRKTFAVLNWVNSRVKANVILGNISSAVAQMANIPAGVGFAKHYSLPGAQMAFKSMFDRKMPIYKSKFMKERYLDKDFRQFDQRLLDQPQKLASVLLEKADQFGATFIWNSSYAKGLAEGVDDPIKYADEQTRRLIAGRGIGEIPLAQKSKVIQLIAPFTLEVGNQWKVMGDFVKTKDFMGLGTLLVANYMINKVAEETRGFGVTFDPIDAMTGALGNEDLNTLEKAGRIGGEFLSNMPMGMYAASVYPEYGMDGMLPTREELFGDRNPQRFGTGLLAGDAITDPVFKLFFPFGGNQISKTTRGINDIVNEGSYIEKPKYTPNIPGVGELNKLRYPTENNKPLDDVKSVLFGPSATSSAKEYYDNNRRPLSENQTTEYQEAQEKGSGQEFYDNLMTEREIKREIQEIKDNKEMSESQKEKEIEKLKKRLKELGGD